jgi:Saxitoxin biosynthesis operon protein SxtJ
MEGDQRLEAGIPARLTPAEGRKFGLLVGGAFLAFATISWWRGHVTAPKVLLVIGLPLVLAGLLVPGRLGPVYRGWMGFAKVLSKVTTPIFMGLVYYVVLTPIGLTRRLFGGDPLVRKPQGSGYWVAREPTQRQRRDMERQF